jgi:hypothetical protein
VTKVSFGIRITLGLATVICVAQHETRKIRKIRTAAVKGVRVKLLAEAILQLTRIGGLLLFFGIFWSLQTHIHWIGLMIAMAIITWAPYLILYDVLLRDLLLTRLDDTAFICG